MPEASHLVPEPVAATAAAPPADASPVGGAAAVSPAETPGLSGLLTLWVCIVVVAALYLAREVLVPITLAVLLSFILAPLANLLRVIRLGRVLSVLLAVLIGLGVVLALAGLIGTQLAQILEQAPKYQSTIEHKIQSVRSYAVDEISSLTSRFAAHNPGPASPGPPAVGVAGSTTGNGAGNTAEQARPSQQGGTAKQGLSAMTLATNVLAPVASPLATTFIVFIVTIFILLQREDLRDRLIRLFGARDIHRTTVAMDDAARRLSRYYLALLAVNACYGCVIGFGLALIGIPSPILWGVLAMLLRFVPYIGPPMGAILPLALAAAVAPGWSKVVYTALLYIVAEGITGQAIEPVLYGHSTGLSPVSVVVAAIFWTWIWGPIGLILSTPLTLCLVVLGRYVPRLEFLNVLLGDQPALTHVESFYQRMLAGDPDEAQDQAELILKDDSLGVYYDEVAMKGLQLAATDAARGVLTPEQLQRIRESIESLIADLAHVADKVAPEEEEDLEALTPEWHGEAPILCVAGRGPLDGAAAAMLAQLLSKHGLGARVLPHEAVSRARIATLSLRDVQMVCLSYLELTGTPAHLRFLLRRLRQRLPSQPILVGFWGSPDAAPRDDRLRREVGADWYVSTLREALAACQEAARRIANAHQDVA